MKRSDDIAELLPPFRVAVQLLIERMRAAGFEPVLHETYRSPERAAKLAEPGKDGRARGIALSMHTLRIAADIVCQHHQWCCGKAGCNFYQRLGAEAERLGFTWGGRFENRDLVHIQGVPVAAQAMARRATVTQLEELVGEYLRPG